MKGGTIGVRLTSKVSRFSVITSPMINVIKQFQRHQDLYTANIHFIMTSYIYLETLFLKLRGNFLKSLGNFDVDFKQCDQFLE